jgi:hypothetical protein
MATRRSHRSADPSSSRGTVALTASSSRDADRPQRVLFIGASSLGPMAAICFKSLALGTRATATFAVRRGGQVRQSAAIDAMRRELGVENWRGMHRTLDAALIAEADLVVTIGSPGNPRNIKLPAVPRRHEHWSLYPQARETQAPVRARKLRDRLRARVAMLVFMEGWGRPEMSRETERLARPTATGGHHPFIPMRPFRVEPLANVLH